MERFAAELTTERLTLARLDPGMEQPLQAVFEAAGDHFTTVTGKPRPDPDAAERELHAASRTEGREVLLVRLREGGDPIGAVGFWERHPEANVALLGMLLIARDRRGAGYGREALRGVEEALRARGIEEMRTGVGAGDERRQAVLTALGFEPLDQRKHVSLDRGRVMIALFQRRLEGGGGAPGGSEASGEG